MEGKIEERIEGYCQTFEQIYKRVSKTNPENAREIAMKIFEEIAKDLRSEQINQSRNSGNNVKQNNNNNNMSPATYKQREAMHKFGVKKIPENLSMKEASEILNRLIGLSKENDRTAIGRTVEELNRKWLRM